MKAENKAGNKNGEITKREFLTGLKKTPSGIKGLDELTIGGLPLNRPTLVVGEIGSGKTFMSMQFILEGIATHQEPGVYLTFEEKAEELLTNVSNVGYDINSMLKQNKLIIEHLNIANYEIEETGRYNIESLFVRIEQAIKKVNAKRIVLDSLDTLFSNLKIHMLRSEFKRLFFWLKEKKVTAIITAESGDNYITRLGLEENVADCVIELTNRIYFQMATRRLRIVKYRGSYHANNEYPFSIDKNGMVVFPIVSESANLQVSIERIGSGIKELDNMLENKGFYVGSTIMVSGSAGTGKTSVLASFIDKASKNGDVCLYCAFEESPNQIIRNMKSIGISLSEYSASTKLHFYFARPSLQNLELHFISIRLKIEELNPAVVVLDPITNLLVEGPNSDVRVVLIHFIDFLKTKNVTVMFSAAITLGSILRNPSDEGISSMVDTWIMLEDIDFRGEMNRVLYVMKSRGMAHSKEVREFQITSNGIRLIPVQKNEKGILIGSARKPAVSQKLDNTEDGRL